MRLTWINKMMLPRANCFFLYQTGCSADDVRRRDNLVLEKKLNSDKKREELIQKQLNELKRKREFYKSPWSKSFGIISLFDENVDKEFQTCVDCKRLFTPFDCDCLDKRCSTHHLFISSCRF
jgi:hypothetical protein